jgi:putative redox protein
MPAKPLDAGTIAALQHTVSSGTVLVVERGDGAFTQVLLDGRHMLLADEPKPEGDDRGPNPYELLLMGLGACTAMTVRMYARRKNVPLEGIQVRLRHARVHEQDCIDCGEDKPKLLDRIDRELEFRGPLSAEQKAKLMEIAEKCPVHRTLSAPIKIVTALAS